MIVLKKHSWFFMHTSSFIHTVVLVSRKEGKLVALLDYSSFRRITTSMLRTNSLFISSGSQAGCAKMMTEYEFTPYSVQHCGAA